MRLQGKRILKFVLIAAFALLLGGAVLAIAGMNRSSAGANRESVTASATEFPVSVMLDPSVQGAIFVGTTSIDEAFALANNPQWRPYPTQIAPVVVRLDKDVQAKAPLAVSAGRYIRLDLNGHKLAASGTRPAHGGVITNNGWLEIVDGSENNSGGMIAGGYATGGGGGIYSTGTLVMRGGKIAGNRSFAGAGVMVHGIGNQTASFTMYGGAIEGNYADIGTGGTWSNSGGGVLVHENAEFLVGKDNKGHYGAVRGNFAANTGGGVILTSKTSLMVIDGGEVSGNTSNAAGGGVYVNDGSFKADGDTTIANNSAQIGSGMFIRSATAGKKAQGIEFKKVTIGGEIAAAASTYQSLLMSITDCVLDNKLMMIYNDGAQKTTSIDMSRFLSNDKQLVARSDGKYTVYTVRAGSGSVQVLKPNTVYDRQPIAAGAEFIASNSYGAAVSYAYSGRRATGETLPLTDGLPADAGTWQITAKFAMQADHASKTVYCSNTVSFSVTIGPADIAGYFVRPSDELFSYDGQAHFPSIASTEAAAGLIENRDYTMSGTTTSQTAAGNYVTILAGKGNYTGYAIVNWTIGQARQPIRDHITIIGPTSFQYDGQSHFPEIDTNGLVLNRDYTISGTTTRQINAGDYTTVYTGIGNYEGSVSFTWKITSRQLADNITYDTKLVYNGSAQTAWHASGISLNVVGDGGRINVGSYHTTLTAVGYEGSVVIDWVIEAAPLGATVTGAGTAGGTSVSFPFDGEPHGSEIEIVPTGLFAADEGKATVEYLHTDGTWSAEKPIFTEKGMYMVEYRVICPNYNTHSGNYQIGIGMSFRTLKNNTPKEIVYAYDGQAHAFTASIEGFPNGETMETAAGFRVEYSLDGNTWRTEPYTATNVADSVLIYYRTFYAGYEQIADSCTLKIRPSVETSGGGKPTVTSGNDEGVTYHYAGIEGTDYDSKDPPSTPGKYRLTTTTKEGIVTTYDFTINEPINITAIAVGIAVGAFVLIVCVAVFVVALKKRKQQAQAMAS